MQFVGRNGQCEQADNCPAAIKNLYICMHCIAVNSVSSQRFSIAPVLLLSYVICIKCFFANMAWRPERRRVIVECNEDEIDALHKSKATYEASKKQFIAAFQPIIW